MNILWFAVLTAALATASPMFAQDRPTVAAPANSIYVGADGKYESAPDTALFQFNISVQESKAQAAYQRASEAAEQVRQLLKSNQIDPQSAEIGFFALQPVYDYRDPKRKLVGYRVNTSVSLKLKDFANVGPIVAQLSDLDVTQNQTLNYLLENMETAKARAVEDAYHKAREEALTLARASGRNLGELSYASVDVQYGGLPVPVPMMARAMRTDVAAAPAPTAEFTPQKITVSAHVNALFLLK
ncbi:MAG TPA: SIMPL domain-containing protein [Terriglobales bacterium]|nr:SIMPL domain-containing protein [Terriglobales bacterium]